MIYLRSLIFACLQLIITPVSSGVALLTYPFPPVTRYLIISHYARTMLFLARIVCGVKYRVIGAENIPEGPFVLLSNHQSAWETFAFQAIFPPQVWVMKRELLKVPFFGWGLAMTSPIAIDRGAGRAALKQLLDQGKDRLGRGFCVVVFPEGTRMAPGQIEKFQVGGAWLATHAQVPALPVCLNAGYLWKKNAFLKHPGTITVSIGKAIATRGVKPNELNEQVENWVRTEAEKIGKP